MKLTLPLKLKSGLPLPPTRCVMLLLAGCLLGPAGSRAADSWSLPNSSIGTVNWQDVAWTKNGAAASGQYPGSPGGSASDLIITSGSGTLHTNGSHTIAGFEKFGPGSLSLRGYTSSNTNVNQNDVLTISGTLKVTAGTLTFRSRKEVIQTLSVSAAVAEVATSGSLVLGNADTALGSVNFGKTIVHQGGTLLQHRTPIVNLGELTNNGLISLYNTDSVATGSNTTAVTSLSGTGTITSGSSNLSLTLAITGSNGSAATFGGVIENTTTGLGATLRVAKGGTGVQIFSGANTYSGGTVISGGVLAVTNESGSGFGSGAVRVETGGTLAGSGIVASGTSIQALSGAIVAPGAGLGQTAVTLRLSGAQNGAAPILIMAQGAEFQFNLSPGEVSDRIEFLSYTEGDLVLDAVNGTAVNVSGIGLGTYQIFSFSALSSTEGEALAAQLRLGSGFEGFEQSNFFYMNNGIHLNAVPEPSMLALAGVGMASLAWWRRQRKTR